MDAHLHNSCGDYPMIRRVMKGLRGMVLLGINVNTEDRYRGWGRLCVSACVAWCQRVWSVWCGGLMNHGSVNSCRATYGNVVQRMVMYGGVLCCMALLAACNKPPNARPPVGVSCHSFTSGRIMSQGISEGQSSMGESKGVQKTRLICILIHTQEELDAIIESQE
jgi:hypothetical protein